MKYLILILSVFLIFRSFSPTLAFENNKYGIHITNPSDLEKAAELVNSNGGDWGWVTMVIQENDRNIDKWQAFFDQCRELHLIPLIRVATYADGDVWAKPKNDQVENWYSFFNQLNWPISDRYIVVYNEPNHDKEWGGDANPKEYAHILDSFITTFSKNPKFNILNAGMDLAAPNGSTTQEAFGFLREMSFEIPGIFNRLAGWSSHSYPNHGFLGKPDEYKKTSIRGYQFELSFLKNELGVNKYLPIYITETGWPFESSKCLLRKASKASNNQLKIICTSKYYTPERAAEYIKYAYENYWLKDERVMAVTPFTLNYPYTPFLEFSWLDTQGNPLLPFLTIKDISKIDWHPVQEAKYEIKIKSSPKFLPANYTYNGLVSVKNVGETITFEDQITTSVISSSSAEIVVSNINIDKKLKPGEFSSFNYTVSTSSESGNFYYGWGDTKENIKVFPESIISKVSYSFWQNVIIRLSNLLHKGYN